MLKMLGRFRTHIAALVVAAGLGVGAGALGFDEQLFIMAPTEVVGGNPINGYVVGIEDLGVVNACLWMPGPDGPVQVFLGPAYMGVGSPLWFFYPTLECMAPAVVTIIAADSDESDLASVIIK